MSISLMAFINKLVAKSERNIVNDKLLENNCTIATVATEDSVHQQLTDTLTSSESNKITSADRDNSLLNIYTIIIVAIVALVLIVAMISGVMVYKIRLNYLIKRQINQLKRIDEQLGIKKDYRIDDGFYCIHL